MDRRAPSKLAGLLLQSALVARHLPGCIRGRSQCSVASRTPGRCCCCRARRLSAARPTRQQTAVLGARIEYDSGRNGSRSGDNYLTQSVRSCRCPRSVGPMSVRPCETRRPTTCQGSTMERPLLENEMAVLHRLTAVDRPEAPALRELLDYLVWLMTSATAGCGSLRRPGHPLPRAGAATCSLLGRSKVHRWRDVPWTSARLRGSVEYLEIRMEPNQGRLPSAEDLEVFPVSADASTRR